MRINLHINNLNLTKYPVWFEIMLNDYIEQFRKEYQVTENDVYIYFFKSQNFERIKKLFKDHTIDVETYEIDGLPSKGIIVPDDNPIIVEYKLKYGTEKQQNES